MPRHPACMRPVGLEGRWDMRDDADRRAEMARFQELTEGRRWDRGTFLSMCAILGVSATTARLTPASAATQEIVLVNWGGDSVSGMQAAFVDPFVKARPDTKMVIDGAGPASGKVRAMVRRGKITWDVMDRNLHASIELGREGLLEKIDYSVVDRSKVRPEHAGEWGVGNYLYAHTLTYNTKAWGGRVPTSWADLWNLKEFPGK